MEVTDSIRQNSTVSLLEEMERKYKSIPMEAIVKQDILRQGIHFLKEAFDVTGKYKTKDYFIFSFDHIPLSEIGEGADVKAPEEIKVSGGHFSLLPTVISTRNNPNSPYKVKKSPDGNPSLYLGETFLGNVEFPPLPSWYRHKTKNGKLPGEIAPVIEWGYLIYLTVFRNCQYFGKEEECAYCDINHNYRQQKNAGRPYTGVKDIEDILEVLSWIDAEDQTAKVYTITGGSVITSLKKRMKSIFIWITHVQSNLNSRENGWVKSFPRLGKSKIAGSSKMRAFKFIIRITKFGIRIYFKKFVPARKLI